LNFERLAEVVADRRAICYLALMPEPFVQDDTSEDGSDELNGTRIAQIAQLRRSAYRGRSWCLIAAVGLMVATAQLIYSAIRHLQSTGWGWTPVGYLLLAGLGPVLAIRCRRRARELGREAARSTLPEPQRAPDFRSLSDGSHQWRNLRDVQ
jgi:hypothetical protein